MPEYQLPGTDNPEFESLSPFVQAYITAMFWTSEEQLCEESEDREMPSVAVNPETMESRFVGGNSYGFEDLHPDSLEKIIEDCDRFYDYAKQMLRNGDWTDEQAGHDFWLTRNHHGTGFWDRGKVKVVGEQLTKISKAFGGQDCYVGADGKVHVT